MLKTLLYLLTLQAVLAAEEDYENIGEGWCEKLDESKPLCTYTIGSSYEMNPYSNSGCRAECDKYDGCMGFANAKLKQGGCNLYFDGDSWEVTTYPQNLPGFSQCTNNGWGCAQNSPVSDHSDCLGQGGMIGSSKGHGYTDEHFCFRKWTYDPSTEEPTMATDEPTMATLEPTMATDEPTMATEEPTMATLEPTMATEEPTMATEEPTMATDEPTMATDEPTMATDEPTGATDEPTMATEEPTMATLEPTMATAEPTMATDEPTLATDEPTKATTEPTMVTDEPTMTTDEPTKATDEPTGAPSAMPSSGDDDEEVVTKPATADSSAPAAGEDVASSNSSVTDTVTFGVNPVFLAAGCGGGLLILCGLAYIWVRSTSSKVSAAATAPDAADVDAENPLRRSDTKEPKAAVATEADTENPVGRRQTTLRKGTPGLTSMKVKDTSMTEYSFHGEGAPNLTMREEHQTLRNMILELKQANGEHEEVATSP